MQLDQALEALQTLNVEFPVAWAPDGAKGLAITFPGAKTVIAPFDKIVPTLINALYDAVPEHPACVPEAGHHYIERNPEPDKQPERVDTLFMADGNKTVVFGTGRADAHTLPVVDFLKKYLLEG